MWVHIEALIMFTNYIKSFLFKKSEDIFPWYGPFKMVFIRCYSQALPHLLSAKGTQQSDSFKKYYKRVFKTYMFGFIAQG